MAKEFIEMCGIANIIGWIIEFVVLIIIAPVYSMLLDYACITIGQTAKKNRILMAVVTYFVYYVITQCIGTVFSIMVTVLGITGALDGLGIWLVNNFAIAIHIFLCASIVVTAIISAVFWFVTQKIMTQKLNLE